MDEQQIKQIVESVVGRIEDKQTSITLEQAKYLIEQTEKRAKEVGVNAVIAVCNAGGNPVAVHCMDNSYLASYDIAVQKAYTAVALQMPTIQLKELSRMGFRIQIRAELLYLAAENRWYIVDG